MAHRRISKRRRVHAGLLPFTVVLACTLLVSGCASASGLREFTSDGCSLFPDGKVGNRALWCDCCFAHDIAYWRGGTEDERKHADQALRDCVLERTGSKALADLMYQGVRAGGHPVFLTWYRWGYGWSYGRGYAPLTEQEQQQAHEKLEDYGNEHSSGYCRAPSGGSSRKERGQK